MDPIVAGATVVTPTSQAPEPFLRVRGLSKVFGGVHALRDAHLTIGPGEIHGLLGENGSGKSTLIKILAGFHEPEPGAELLVDGRPVSLPLHPGRFRELGFSFVHQDLGLIPSLTALENLRVGELAGARGSRRISWRRERRRARATFAEFGVELDPDAVVEELAPLDRARLAIVRAVEEIRANVGRRTPARGLLVLDEPTVFLPGDVRDELFALVREIAATGASVLFVSHDLEEIKQLTDVVTVLRDGRNHGTSRTADVTEDDLIEMILGRRLEAFSVSRQEAPARSALAAQVEGLSARFVRDLSFEVREGEILGVTGLIGSGFEEVPYLLFGAAEAADGELTVGGERHALTALEPARALELGLALIPADRQKDASVPDLSVADNVMLQVVDRYFSGGRLARRRMAADAAARLEEFDVRPADPRLTYSSLSGGNQQKALLAKWLQTEPRILLLHEPTQGVDVGSRQQIFSFLRLLLTDRRAVLCASSDYEQLAAICDRVLVLSRGRIAAELGGAEITKERIAERCYNAVAAEPTALAAGRGEPA